MDSFGARLRYERERRQIALKSIAERTKIGVGLLEGLERDDVSRWPAGIFRKSFIRSYAAAIGLDPDVIVREFAGLYPDPIEAEFPTPVLESAGSRPAPFGFKVTITWRGTPFGSAVAEARQRWTNWRVSGVPAWMRGIMKTEQR